MPIECAVKSESAPKEMGSNKQRIKRQRNPPPYLHNMVEKGRIMWYNEMIKKLIWRI